ncbi:MAG: hypothetical protein OCD01_19145 [Fibrobacterales bacterium]
MSRLHLDNICPRRKVRFVAACDADTSKHDALERTKKFKDPVLLANAENDLKEVKAQKDELEVFRKELGTYVRYFEFMSQIVDFDDDDLDKPCLFARHLRPMLCEEIIDEDVLDLENVIMSHYRLSEIRRQDLKLKVNSGAELDPPGTGGAKSAVDKKEEYLSQIITRLNEIFITDELTDKDTASPFLTSRVQILKHPLNGKIYSHLQSS